MNWLEEKDKEHYICIGKAVHYWSLIELELYDQLRTQCNSNSLSKLFKNYLIFQKRCDLLLIFVENNFQYDSNALEKVNDILKEMCKLSKTRNKIAHNPLMFWLNNIEDDSESEFVNGILNGIDGNFTNIDMDKIDKFTNECIKVRENFIKIMSELDVD